MYAYDDFDDRYADEDDDEAYLNRGDDEEREYGDEESFADPGGNSALRAATARNPRNLPCPQCGGEELLTPADVARHYVCDGCANQNERGW